MLFLWGADGAVAMLEDVAHGHYGTGLISRATAEMLREKHVRRRAGVAWGTRRLVEALPVPKSESAPKSDSKSNSAPASSSPAARSDEEVDRGANEEVDDEATARTGKVRAAARRRLPPAQEKRPGARPDESATTDPYEDPLPPVRAAPVRGGTALRIEQGAHGGSGLGERPRRGRS